jgi:hypothetical protein
MKKPTNQQSEVQAIEKRLMRLIKSEPIYLCPQGNPTVLLQERFASLFRSVWDRIPRNDQNWILAKANKYKDGLQVLLSYETCQRTNGWVSNDRGLIWFDAWFVDSGKDRLVKALVAHELGHIRGYGDPEWPDRSEAVACLYAERIWRFPGPDPVFKSEICLRLDDVVREVGLKAQVFQYRTYLDGIPEDIYLLLRDGKKLDFNPDDKLERIGGSEDNFDTIAAGIRNTYKR